MSAILSTCNTYRYRLDRNIQEYGKTIAFFGINPSTADALEDDATVRKWRGFTQQMNGKKFIVGNVFSFRSAYVTDLKSTYPLHGDEHFQHLYKIIDEADILIPCWGSRWKLNKQLHIFIDQLLEILLASNKPVMTLGLTKSKDPKHVLMLPYSTPVRLYTDLIKENPL